MLSDSVDGTTNGVTDPGPSVPRLKTGAVDSGHPVTLLANVWQFLPSPAASNLTRFYTYHFMPGETMVNIAEGTSYRVSKRKLFTEIEDIVAVKQLIPLQTSPTAETGHSIQDTLGTLLHELRILAHEPVRENVNVAQLLGYGAEEVGNQLTLYLVADFAPGGTLKEYLTEHIFATTSLAA